MRPHRRPMQQSGTTRSRRRSWAASMPALPLRLSASRRFTRPTALKNRARVPARITWAVMAMLRWVLLQRLMLIASRLQDGSGQVTSRSNLEQLDDKAGLGSHVTSADVPKLPFPDHRHRLIARQRSSRRLEATEAEPWLAIPLHLGHG